MAPTHTLAPKRSRLLFETSTSTSPRKLARFESPQYDGVQSHHSAGSAGSDTIVRAGVRDRVKKRMNNIRAMLLVRGKERNIDEVLKHQSSNTSVIITRPETPRDGMPLDTLAIGRSPSMLTLLGESEEEPQDKASSVLHTAAPDMAVSPWSHVDADSFVQDNSTVDSRSMPTLMRRRSSTRQFQNKLTHKLQQTFGDLTVVHKPKVKARPGLKLFTSNVPHESGNQDSSSPSTGPSSGSSRGQQQTSTPATSDTTAVSPVSTMYCGGSFPGNNEIMIPSMHNVHFPESWNVGDYLNSQPGLSIRTVEATATARIFLETHYEELLRGIPCRALRQQELEDKILGLGLSIETCHTARDLFNRYETNQLRHERVSQVWKRNQDHATSVELAGYEFIKVLGKGSFGVVRLVRRKPSQGCEEGAKDTPCPRDNGPAAGRPASVTSNSTFMCVKSKHDSTPRRRQVYAMKVIRKSEMLRNCQEGHLKAERDFLVAAEGSRWIIPLLAAFQDEKFLYLVMEYCIGGDFLGLLIRQDILGEEVTKWYTAEMILCIEETHRMKWIHRDVKPDNFLIGADGHLKISDFGLAFDGGWQHDQKYFQKQRKSLIAKLGLKVVGDQQDQQEEQAMENSLRLAQATRRSCKKKDSSLSQEGPPFGESIIDWRNRVQRRKLARSVVGTSQYMAPEIIRGDSYDGRCDWWSIGIILYECLYGFTPFACDNRHDTKLKILKHCQALHFPTLPPDQQPSTKAVDLIRQLLVEKECRISTRRYVLNDWTRKTFGPSTGFFASDKESQNYNGYFVYPNDAEDIKNHPWFEGLPWETLHLQRPPFVPNVATWEDTRYFDDEEAVSDIDSSDSDHALKQGFGAKVESNPNDGMVKGSSKSSHQPEAQHIIPSTAIQSPPLHDKEEKRQSPTLILQQPQIDGPTSQPVAGLTRMDFPSRKQKEKRRPRDKILRDADTATVALHMRRTGAFLGYGYHRPKNVEETIVEALRAAN